MSAISVSRCSLQIPLESFLWKKLTYINVVPSEQIGKSLDLVYGYDFAELTQLLTVLLIQISLEIASNLIADCLRL